MFSAINDDGGARRGSAHQLKAPIAIIGTSVLFLRHSSIHDGARGATRPTQRVRDADGAKQVPRSALRFMERGGTEARALCPSGPKPGA